MKRKRKIQLKNISLRAEESAGKKYLIGMIPYNSEGETFGGLYKEIITDTAFNQSLNSKRKILALKNHNDDFTLGNTENGTLILESTKDGLVCKCELPPTTYANDLFISVNRGDVTGMSFGFMPVKEDVKDDVTYLREVKLLEVSFGVAFPFYPDAEAKADLRSLSKQMTKIIKQKRSETMEKETLEILQKLNNDLQEIINKFSSGNGGDTQEPDSRDETSADEEKKKEAEKQKDGSSDETTTDEEQKKKDAEKEEEEKEKEERTALLLELDLIKPL